MPRQRGKTKPILTRIIDVELYRVVVRGGR